MTEVQPLRFPYHRIREALDRVAYMAHALSSMCTDCAGTGDHPKWPGDGGKKSNGPFHAKVLSVVRGETYAVVDAEFLNGTRTQASVYGRSHDFIASRADDPTTVRLTYDDRERHYLVTGISYIEEDFSNFVGEKCHKCWGLGCLRPKLPTRASAETRNKVLLMDLEIAQLMIVLQPEREIFINDIFRRPVKHHHVPFQPALEWLLDPSKPLPPGVRNNPEFKREWVVAYV